MRCQDCGKKLLKAKLTPQILTPNDLATETFNVWSVEKKYLTLIYPNLILYFGLSRQYTGNDLTPDGLTVNANSLYIMHCQKRLIDGGRSARL